MMFGMLQKHERLSVLNSIFNFIFMLLMHLKENNMTKRLFDIIFSLLEYSSCCQYLYLFPF